jgi:hypothetical protein
MEGTAVAFRPKHYLPDAPYYTDPLRIGMPYGEWTCADGRRVLFNRLYEPILERIGDDVRPATNYGNNVELVQYVSQHTFFNDSNPPWRSDETLQRCRKILEEWGVKEKAEVKPVETFKLWLLRRRVARCHPHSGDFIGDMKTDRTFPASPDLTWDRHHSYLLAHNACPEAIAAGKRLWRQYVKAKASTKVRA